MSTINQSGWKPEMGSAGETGPATYTGNKALMLEEALIFEIGTTDTTGVDIAPAPKVASRLGGLDRNTGIGLPGLSGYEVARRLRAEPGLAGVLLVAVTGWGTQEPSTSISLRSESTNISTGSSGKAMRRAERCSRAALAVGRNVQIDWSWWWVLCPMWIGLAIILAIIVVAALCVLSKKGWDTVRGWYR